MFSPNMLGLNLLKIKNFKAVLRGFIEIVNQCKPNKLWVHEERELYNDLMQKWLSDNDILMFSAHK